MNKIIKLFAIVLLIFTNACATTKKISLTDFNRSMINNVKLIICVPQNNIFVEIDSAAAEVAGQVGMQYGAIGALIGGLTESSIKSGEKKIEPLKNFRNSI